MKRKSILGGKKRLFLLSYLFLVSFIPPSVSGASAQNVSLSMRNALMKEIMQEIKRVSQYDFIVSDSDISGVPRKTISFTDASIDQVLTECLAGTGLTYTIDDATIVVFKNSQQPQQKSPLRMVITGRVTDADGRPVVGTTVVIKNSPAGVHTDNNGSYRLNVPDGGQVTLVFSYIGMETQEIVVPMSRNTVDVRMVESLMEVREVVITGIFDKARESYTGAARTISEQELRRYQGRNLISTIANVDPSFKIIQNNSWGSNPNRLPEVQIRGASNLSNLGEITDETNAALNTPLIIMDGFETTLERMMDLDENEVVSVTLLKDGAATALYGSRGANGIIVITTRQPQGGRLSFYYKGGVRIEAADLTEYDLLNAREKFELENRAGLYEASNKYPLAAIQVQQYRSDIWQQILEGVDTYWMSKPLRVGVGQNHNMRLEGGEEAFRYALSLQYNNIEGIMKGSSRDNINGGVNLSYYHRKLIFRNNMTVGYNESVNSKYGSFADYVKLNPYWKPYNEDGSVVKQFPYEWNYWTQNNTFFGPYTNPLYNTTLNTIDKSDYINITDNFSIEWKPIDALTLRGQVGISAQIGSSDLFKPSDHTDFANYSGSDVFRKGSYSYSDSRAFDYSTMLTANYNKIFADKHRLYAGLGLDATQNKFRIYTFQAEGFPNDKIDFLPMALQYALNGSPTGSESRARRIGAVGSVNYGFMERYYIDASLRVDGNSQYGKDKRYGTFWSTGVAWSVHHERFMEENLPFVSNLKLRATFGVTGSPLTDAYSAQSTYRYYNNDNYNGWIGAYQIALGNPNLGWQQTDKYNLGMELSLFDNILNLQAEFYLTKTSLLISSLELPYSNGFTSYQANIGSLENRGVELGAIVWLMRDQVRNIQWSVTGNMAYATDKITRLSEALKAEMEALATARGSVPNTIFREGDSQNTIYVVKSLGIDPSTGRELYLNRDGEVTYDWRASDRVAAGIDYPTYKGNFSTMLRYRDFTFNASFGFFWGGQQYNSTLIERVENADLLMNVDKRVFTDRWVNPGDRTFFRGLTDKTKVNYSSRFVQDNAALFCQNITAQYTFRDREWMKNTGISALSLSANTGELFYWTTIRQERGISYPFSRQFAFSASILF